jgi:hypothetical protein
MVASPGLMPLSLPGDCARPDVLLDVISPSSAVLTQVEAESRSGGMGDGRPADSAVLGRVTMARSDFYGNPIQARPAWVLYWAGLMHRLPSGGPAVKFDAPPTTRPLFYSTAAVMVIDAITGDALLGVSCGVRRI